MPTQTSTRFDLDAAPLAVREITLLVRDLPRTAEFYGRALGLKLHDEGSDRIVLGAARPFITLETRSGLPAPRRGRPGLFHAAFLLPERHDLGDWLDHAVAIDLPLTGASDHAVSEAVYLDDPEGNGIEVYVDRPVEAWHGRDGRIAMTTSRLALDAIPRGDGWAGAPDATRIGHVHLRSADLATDDAFWTAEGFRVTARYPGASFFGSGGYHHQIAANVWNSAGGAPRGPDEPGLARLVLEGAVPAPRSVTAPNGVAVVFEPRTA